MSDRLGLKDDFFRFIPDNDVIMHYTGRRTEVPHSVGRKAVQMRILKRFGKECQVCHVRPGKARWLLCYGNEEKDVKKYFNVRACDTCYNEVVEGLFGESYFTENAPFKANLLFVHLRNKSNGYLNFADMKTQRYYYPPEKIEDDVVRPRWGVKYGYSSARGCFYRATRGEVLYFKLENGKEIPISYENDNDKK